MYAYAPHGPYACDRAAEASPHALDRQRMYDCRNYREDATDRTVRGDLPPADIDIDINDDTDTNDDADKTCAAISHRRRASGNRGLVLDGPRADQRWSSAGSSRGRWRVGTSRHHGVGPSSCLGSNAAP